MRLRWTPTALRNLSEIHTYIADNSEIAAARIMQLLQTQAESLADFPGKGRPGRIPRTRELITVGLPYIIAYRISDQNIEIIAVRHSSRKWPKSFENHNR